MNRWMLALLVAVSGCQGVATADPPKHDLVKMPDVHNMLRKDAEAKIRAAGLTGEIVLYNLGGEIFASEAFCTHGHAQLAGGYVEGDKVQCPMHGGMFDIRTGKVAGDPCTVDLKMFPVKIEGGAVLVALPSDQ